MPTLRLTYFDSPGRAEPVRIALALAKLPFEDKRIAFPEFMALKQAGAFPLGAVPVLEVDGVAMVQTAAMLRYAGRAGAVSLYPSDALAAFRVDSVVDTFNDTVSHALTPSMFERDVEKKLAMRKALVEGPLKLALTYVEGLLGATEGPFVNGSALSIADILLGETVAQYRSGRLDGISGETLAPYPRVVRLGDAYAAHPDVLAATGRNG